MVRPHPQGEDPARGLLEGAGDSPGMATDPGSKGHRCSREEGQADRAVQSVDRDCLAALAEGRDMRRSWIGEMVAL